MPLPAILAAAGEAAATAGASAGAGGLMGMIFGGVNDRRQVKQQRRLNELQKGMTEFNLQKQMELWEKTGYVATKDQIKRAGLNPALLYGMSGAGGQSTNVATGGGSQAPVGGGEMQAMAGMGIQGALLKAQMENINADTEKKKAEAAATAGVQTDAAKQTIEESKARQANLMQGLDNLREDYNIKRLQQSMMNIENYEKQASQGDRLDYITIQAKQAERALQTAKNEGKVSDETVMQKIQIIKQEAIGAVLKNALTRATTKNTEKNTAVSEQKINESVQSIMMNWDKMSQYNKEVMIKDVLKDFGTDPVNDIIPEIADGVGDILKGAFKK